MAVSFSRQAFKPRGGATIASRMTMHSVTSGQRRDEAVGAMFNVADAADARRRVLDDDISRIRDKFASAQFRRASERFEAAGRDTAKPPVLDVIYVDAISGKPVASARGMRFAGGATYVGGLLSVDRRGLRLPPMYALALERGEAPTSLVPVNAGRASVSVPVSFSPNDGELARLLTPVANHVSRKLSRATGAVVATDTVADALGRALESTVGATRDALNAKLPVVVDPVRVERASVAGGDGLLSVVEIGSAPGADRVAWLVMRALCESGRIVAMLDPAVEVVQFEVCDVSTRDVPGSMFTDTVVVSCAYRICERSGVKTA